MEVRELFAYIGLGLILLYLFITEAKERYSSYKKNKEWDLEYSKWLREVEPTYRNLKTYPPDWDFRRLYVQKKFRYTCSNCGRSIFPEKDKKVHIKDRRHVHWSGVHVHHVIPLSKGGR